MSRITFELLSNVNAEIVQGPCAAMPVRWLGGLSFGVQPTDADYEDHIQRTIGSALDELDDSKDELRFRPDTGEIASGIFGVPRFNTEWERWRHVMDLPVMGSGTLRLLDRRSFSLDQARIAAFDPEGSLLVGMLKGSQPGDVDGRVEVLPGLFFLLFHKRYCGWCVLDPTSKLCVPGEELQQLSTDELQQARKPLSEALIGLNQLRRDDDNPVRSDRSTLELRLEALGSRLGRELPGAASRPVMTMIETSLEREILAWEASPRPLILAEARNLKTGKTFDATDRDARLLSRRELHPVLRERVDAQERIVRLHRYLRWPEPKVLVGKTTNTQGISELIQEQPDVLREFIKDHGVPTAVIGLSTFDQFCKTNEYIASCEQRKGRGVPSGLLDWVRVLCEIGNHAEVRAVHNALREPAPGVTGRTKQKKASKSKDSSCELQDIELSLDALSLDDESQGVPIPRCVHCQFITHGVKPSRELKRVESPKLRSG